MKAAAALMLAAAACGSGKAPPAEQRVAAAPTPTTPEGHEKSSRGSSYDAELRRGWDLAHGGNYPGAVVAFETALQFEPDDARALDELSWSALHAGDLDKARTSADRAIAVAQDPVLQAKALYNRGRVAELDGDPTKALALYQKSDALRANREVERRIRSLGADAPRSTLAGPFAKLDDFCAEIGLPVASGDPTLEDDVWCSPEPDRKLPPRGWFDQALVIHHADAIGSVSADLALHDARGWWVMVDVDDAQLRDIQVAKP